MHSMWYSFTQQWLTIYARASVRGNTYIGYRSVVNNHILPLLSEIKLQKLRGIDIQNMVNTIKDNGGGPHLAELAFAVLRIALNKAFNEEILHRLPFKTVSLPKKRRKEFVPIIMSTIFEDFLLASIDNLLKLWNHNVAVHAKPRHKSQLLQNVRQDLRF